MRGPETRPTSHPSRRARSEQMTTAVKGTLILGFQAAGLLVAWLAAGSPLPDLGAPPYSDIMYQLPAGWLPLSRFVLTVAGSLFSWQALRFLLVANLAALIPLLFGARFVQHLYNFDSFGLALNFFQEATFDPALYHTRAPQGEETLHPDEIQQGGRRVALVKDGKLTPARNEPHNRSIAWAGGPGRVVIPPEYAVQLERNGHLSYVAGPGVARLRRFEKVYKVIHLRHIVRRRTVTALTRDGIPVQLEVVVHSRIQTDDEASRQTLYPFDKRAIRRLTLHTLITKDGPQLWEDRAIDLADNVLNEVLAKYRLDALFEPLDEIADPRLAIQNEVRRMLNQLVRSAGIQVTDVWLGQFQLPDEVTQQFVTFWQSEWQRRATELRADGEATLIRELGNAHSKAQQVLIETLVAAFQSAQDSGLDIDPKQLAALRLIDSLEAAYQQAGKLGKGAGLRRPPFNRLRQEVHPKQAAEPHPGKAGQSNAAGNTGVTG